MDSSPNTLPSQTRPSDRQTRGSRSSMARLGRTRRWRWSILIRRLRLESTMRWLFDWSWTRLCRLSMTIGSAFRCGQGGTGFELALIASFFFNWLFSVCHSFSLCLLSLTPSITLKQRKTNNRPFYSLFPLRSHPFSPIYTYVDILTPYVLTKTILTPTMNKKNKLKFNDRNSHFLIRVVTTFLVSSRSRNAKYKREPLLCSTPSTPPPLHHPSTTLPFPPSFPFATLLQHIQPWRNDRLHHQNKKTYRVSRDDEYAPLILTFLLEPI